MGLATLAVAGLFNAAHATFPGENGVIVFDSNNHGASTTIKRMSPGNSAVTDLGIGSYPSVSPNGKKIAFLKGTDVYVMNIDGSNVVQLTSGQTAYSPAWLPDGSKVAYGLLVTGSTQIELWTVKPNGTGKARLRQLDTVKATTGGLDLAWSPSGNIYTFNGDGLNISDDVNPGTVRKLATDGSGSSWAPDGASIMFHDAAQKQFEINPDGTNRRSVPSIGDAYNSSAISPDGAFIASGVFTTQPQLATRTRAGTTPTFSWPVTVKNKADWSRVPSNCHASTPQGGGGVMPGDADFYAVQCAIAVMPDGGQKNGVLQQAIAIGPDQRVYSSDLKAGPVGLPPIWSGFVRVPGVGGNPNGINAKKIAIAASKDGSAQVLIIGANDNLVYHAMSYANGSWSGFTAIHTGTAWEPNFAARDVAIAIHASSPTSPGTAVVVVNDLYSGQVFENRRRADGNWGWFRQLPKRYDDPDSTSQALAVCVGEDGYANIVATFVRSDGTYYLKHQAATHEYFFSDGWSTVGTPAGVTLSASSDVALTRTLSGTAQLVFTDSAGNAYFQERSDISVRSSWESQVTTTPIISTVARGVSISAGATADSSSKLLLTRTFPQ